MLLNTVISVKYLKLQYSVSLLHLNLVTVLYNVPMLTLETPRGRSMAKRRTDAKLSGIEAGEFLQNRRLALGLKADQILDLTGMPSPSYLSALENATYNPGTSKYFPKWAKALRLTEDEILAINPGLVVQSSPVPDVSAIQTQTIFKTSSGTAYATRPQFHDYDYIEQAIVHIHPDDDYPGLEIWIGSGTSMEPEIEDGATLYVDTRDRIPVDGLIYVFRIPGDGACVKRVRNLGGTLWLQSDNTDHEAFQVEEAEIVGRVDMSQPKPKKVRKK